MLVVVRPVVVPLVEPSDEQPIAAATKKKRHLRMGVPRLEMMSGRNDGRFTSPDRSGVVDAFAAVENLLRLFRNRRPRANGEETTLGDRRGIDGGRRKKEAR
jgi:hypothetical protein